MKRGQYLLSHEFSIKKEFGGALLKRSHAKKPRPISTKNAMHLTLRSSKAKGRYSFLASRARRLLIETKIREVAEKFGVSIYKIAIVGNHIHLLLRATSRRGFIFFLRAITGIIARIVLGAERGRAQLATGQARRAGGRTRQERERFWDQRPWTRVIAWMKDFANVKKYVAQNFKEAMGFVPYQPRKKYSSTA
jgi:REP element-mobilizing transposase RayT